MDDLYRDLSRCDLAQYTFFAHIFPEQPQKKPLRLIYGTAFSLNWFAKTLWVGQGIIISRAARLLAG